MPARRLAGLSLHILRSEVPVCASPLLRMRIQLHEVIHGAASQPDRRRMFLQLPARRIHEHLSAMCYALSLLCRAHSSGTSSWRRCWATPSACRRTGRCSGRSSTAPCRAATACACCPAEVRAMLLTIEICSVEVGQATSSRPAALTPPLKCLGRLT